MSFSAAVKSVFSKYATFEGRARRSEFWFFTLFTGIVHALFSVILIIASVAIFAGESSGTQNASGGITLLIIFVWFAFGLAVMIPSYAVWARRLHDMGQSGHWLWLNLVSLGIVPLVMAFLDSQPGANSWGPNPKGVSPAPPVHQY